MSPPAPRAIDDMRSGLHLLWMTSIRIRKYEDKVAVCPAFSQVGERFGRFDVALLPISPWVMWSNLNGSPADVLSVQSRTWVLKLKPVLEPPDLLKKIPALGEAVLFQAGTF
ncbi:hypothetical protein EI94DRAFT_1697556 [Lactarius quietus]|nr:hypothetical protein EI94DRAFT_1697556 [Lactarius quietus]